ncbi:MAG TPA: hypothetical protein VFB19_18585 [Mycobacterium sp.]|nr:hypothetical protein [Mycobacterium sp.]
MKVSLPGENWAHLRDPSEVTERQRRPLTEIQERISLSNAGAMLIAHEDELEALSVKDQLRLLREAGATPEELALLRQGDDRLLLALVSEWSFDAPVTEDGMLDVPSHALDALKKECQKYAKALSGGTTDEDVLADDSPTPRSDG